MGSFGERGIGGSGDALSPSVGGDMGRSPGSSMGGDHREQFGEDGDEDSNGESSPTEGETMDGNNGPEDGHTAYSRATGNNTATYDGYSGGLGAYTLPGSIDNDEHSHHHDDDADERIEH